MGPPVPEPAIRLPRKTTGPGPCTGERDWVQLAGYFLLRPSDGYGITVILTGTPAADFRHPIQLDGMLPDGRVTTCPMP